VSTSLQIAPFALSDDDESSEGKTTVKKLAEESAQKAQK